VKRRTADIHVIDHYEYKRLGITREIADMVDEIFEKDGISSMFPSYRDLTQEYYQSGRFVQDVLARWRVISPPMPAWLLDSQTADSVEDFLAGLNVPSRKMLSE